MQRPNTIKVLVEAFRKWKAKRARDNQRRMFRRGYDYAALSINSQRTPQEKQQMYDKLTLESLRFRRTKYNQYAQGIAEATWNWKVFGHSIRLVKD